MLNLTHFQSLNCDRTDKCQETGTKIKMIEWFKLGQDKTTEGNVNMRFEFFLLVLS